MDDYDEKKEELPCEDEMKPDVDKKATGEHDSLKFDKFGIKDSKLWPNHNPQQFQRKVRRKSSLLMFLESEEKNAINEDISQAVGVDTNLIPWQSGPHCMNCYLGQKHECNDDAKYLEGIERKVFFIKNGGGTFELSKKREEGSAVISYIVKYQTGTPDLPFHDHPKGEEYLVLKGAFDDTEDSAPAGTYVKYPHNTSHSACPEGGAEILTWWGQNNNDDEAQPLAWWGKNTSSHTMQSISTIWKDPVTDKSSFWTPVGNSGAYELVLFKSKNTGEQTYMLRLGAEAHTTIVAKGGIELFVLEGNCMITDENENDLNLEKGWWLREMPNFTGSGVIVLKAFQHTEDNEATPTFIIKTNHLIALMD